jgi:hypothetical protein
VICSKVAPTTCTAWGATIADRGTATTPSTEVRQRCHEGVAGWGSLRRSAARTHPQATATTLHERLRRRGTCSTAVPNRTATTWTRRRVAREPNDYWVDGQFCGGWDGHGPV